MVNPRRPPTLSSRRTGRARTLVPSGAVMIARYDTAYGSSQKRIGAIKLNTGRVILSLHGLRKSVTSAAYRAGCAPQQVIAVLSWKTLSMAQARAKATGRRPMATAAIHILEQHERG